MLQEPTDEIGYEEKDVLLLLYIRVYLLQLVAKYSVAIGESFAVRNVSVLHRLLPQTRASSSRQVEGFYGAKLWEVNTCSAFDADRNQCNAGTWAWSAARAQARPPNADKTEE